MARRHEVINAQQLRWQQDWVFSVNGQKAKLLSYGQHEAIFAILKNGKISYNKDTSAWLIAITLLNIWKTDSIYKLWSWK